MGAADFDQFVPASQGTRVDEMLVSAEKVVDHVVLGVWSRIIANAVPILESACQGETVENESKGRKKADHSK